jgi:DNA polymerase (family 10)
VGDVLSVPEGHRIPVNVFICDAEEWGSSLHYTTGSRAYNISVRNIAKSHGLFADQHGVFRRVGNRKGSKIAGSGETELAYCQTIGVPWMQPRERVNDGVFGTREPRPTWCVDHVTYDHCRRSRRLAQS